MIAISILAGRPLLEHAHSSSPRFLAFDPVSKHLIISYEDGLLSWVDLTQGRVVADLVVAHCLRELQVLPHQRFCIGISGPEHVMYAVALKPPTIRRMVHTTELPVCLLADPTSDTIFLAGVSQAHDLLYTINGRTGAVLNRASIGRAALALTIDPRLKRLFVVNLFAPSLPIIDTATGELLDTISLPSKPSGMALDTVTGDLFISTVGAGIAILHSSDGSLSTDLSADYVYGSPWGCLPILGGMGVDIEARRVILGYQKSQVLGTCAVTILDSETHRLVSRHEVPGDVMAVRVHGDKHHAYVLYQTRDESGSIRSRILTLQVLDTRSGSILHEEVVGTHPLDVLLVEPRNQLFIADAGEKAVVCVEDMFP